MTPTTDGTTTERRDAPTFEVPVPETDAADVEDPARCPYCNRPFRTERLRDLHVGEVHPRACTDEEYAAYEAAFEDEKDDMFTFHMKIVVTLGLLFFAFVFSYMGVVTVL